MKWYINAKSFYLDIALLKRRVETNCRYFSINLVDDFAFEFLQKAPSRVIRPRPMLLFHPTNGYATTSYFLVLFCGRLTLLKTISKTHSLTLSNSRNKQQTILKSKEIFLFVFSLLFAFHTYISGGGRDGCILFWTVFEWSEYKNLLPGIELNSSRLFITTISITPYAPAHAYTHTHTHTPIHTHTHMRVRHI